MAPDWNAALTAVISHPLFSVGITLGVFQLAQLLYEQTRLMLFQPLLLSTLALVGIFVCWVLIIRTTAKAARCRLFWAGNRAGNLIKTSGACSVDAVLQIARWRHPQPYWGWPGGYLVPAHDHDGTGAQVGDDAHCHAGG